MGNKNHDDEIMIEQINANSINNKRNEIGLYLERKKSKSHVLCVNDTRLKKSQKIKFKGYKTFRSDLASGKSLPGGVAIFVRNELKASEIECHINEMCIIEFAVNGKTIRVGTIYLHPGCHLQQHHIDVLNKNIPNNSMLILIGDLNAHTGIDYRKKTDRAGHALNSLISGNNYTIMNDESPTYFSAQKCISSCIDICLVKSNGCGFTSSWSTGESIGSDHIITSLRLNCKFSAEVKKIQKTDWEAVRSDLEKFDPIIRGANGEEIESSIEEMNEGIRNAIVENTKSAKMFTRDNISLSKSTSELIRFRRKLIKLRKGWESHNKPTEIIRHMINSSNREIKKLIKRDVERKMASKIEEIWEQKDASKSWKQLKEIEPDIGKKREDEACISIKDSNGILQKDDETLANIHANRLKESHSFPTDLKFDENFRHEIEKEVDDKLPDCEPNFANVDETLREAKSEDFFETDRIGRNGRKIPPKIHDDKITANEIYHRLRRKKNRSSAGEDGINYKVLKHAGKNVIGSLAKLFTILLVAGYFPLRWRSVKITMIPKSGKDLKEAKNWRPISLSSCTSKLFESCVKERIEKERIKRKIKENDYQAAYKEGRSCQEHILRLSEDISHGFAERKCTIGVFLDVSGAFDKVWVQGLLWKVLKMQLPKPLVGLVHGFLACRSLRVKVGSKFSPKVEMSAGTPQGAVLSPSLFNFFVDDLRDIIGIGDGIELAQYADDIAIWSTNLCPKQAEKDVNEALKKIAIWTSKWRIKLAPEKSVFILFSRRPTIRKTDVKLELLGEKVQQVSNHRFLGVKFDDRLEWKNHINEMIGIATPRINAIKRIAAKSIWRNPERILRLHESVVNSIWKFGALSYATAGVKLWDSITKCHARCIKAYCGLPNFVGYNTLCEQLGIKPIKDELMAFGKKRLTSIVAFSPFGPNILRNRRRNITGIYKSPSEILLDDQDAGILMSQRQ